MDGVCGVLEGKLKHFVINKKGDMVGNRLTRRSFLDQVVAATFAAMGTGVMLSGRTSEEKQEKSWKEIPDGATILFQGDSITDAGRDKNNSNPNDPWALGQGYAFLASARMREILAEKNILCYNRGISGNKVFQLAERWQEDCLALQPDLMSILIGVNDFWHTRTHNYEGTVEVYERDYRNLLYRTKVQLPEVTLIIGEPFIVEEGSAVDKSWLSEFKGYQQAARALADETDAAFIPFQEVFDEASQRVDPTYWTEDGVHPTMAGSQLMAQAWLETVKLI